MNEKQIKDWSQKQQDKLKNMTEEEQGVVFNEAMKKTKAIMDKYIKESNEKEGNFKTDTNWESSVDVSTLKYDGNYTMNATIGKIEGQTGDMTLNIGKAAIKLPYQLKKNHKFHMSLEFNAENNQVVTVSNIMVQLERVDWIGKIQKFFRKLCWWKE